MTKFQPIEIGRTSSALDKSSDAKAHTLPKSEVCAFTSTPTIPAWFYEAFPQPLRGGCQAFNTEREKDIFLLSALGVLSGCLPTVHGIYDGTQIGTNLFVFVVAPAGSGKGVLSWARILGLGYHKHKCAQSNAFQEDYQLRQQQARQAKIVFEERAPAYQTLFLPGNSSAAAFLKALIDNGERGVICETEADTLSGALKQDWGDYSDLLRKAFHHEPISYLRKSGERYELEQPAISVVLSGTPGQATKLISDAENGLFSRFLFYCFQADAEWRDVSPASGRPLLNTHFASLTEYTTQMALHLESFDLIRVEWTGRHWELFNRQMT